MNRKELKSKALEHLKGHWGYAILAVFLCMIILGGVGGATAGIVALVFSSTMLVGLYSVFLDGSRKGEYDIGTLFVGFKDNLVEKIILSLYKALMIFLWTLLFIIPGIIKAYSYYAAEYIAAEHPDYSFKKCLTESERLMKGHKWEFFVLQLSFIGWAILGMFTFGILYFWLMPYIVATETEYFIALMGQDSALSKKDPVITAEIVK